jgi:two-component system, NtrC family, response regulator AtoC
VTGPAGLRVLVVDDDPAMLGILDKHLTRLGHDTEVVGGAVAALGALERRPRPDVILSDVRMPGMDGRTLLAEVRALAPEVRVVLMTAFGEVRDALEAVREGAFWYLTKPFKVEEVAALLRNIAEQIGLGRTVQRLEREARREWPPERFLGRSERAQEVRARLVQAAALPSTVLLLGRSGTGKELAARILHHASPRAAAPFVAVNCAAIPETIFESEFFGHRRGAFTGADRDAPGLVEEAAGGTLFLDEVGELPLAQQPKLLRLLEEREYRRVGDRAAAIADVRVVAASNRSLEEMVAAGRFREDLFYRLNVLALRLPDLAARRGDIDLLAEAMLAEAARAAGLRARGFTAEAVAALRAHAWPGNVRELRNAVEQALFHACGPTIDVDDLPASVRGARVAADRPVARSLDDVEREHIRAVLLEVGGHRSRAAQILGIDRRTLFTKIQRYGLGDLP